MNSIQSIEQFLDQTDSNILRKVKKSPLQGALLIAIGFLFLLLNLKADWQSAQFVSPSLITLSAIFILWGGMTLIFSKRYYVTADTRQKIKTYELYFDGKERDKLVRIMKNGTLEELKTLHTSTHDGLKLKIMTTKDSMLCYSQIVTFVPYEYVNVTEVKLNTPAEAHILQEMIKLLKN